MIASIHSIDQGASQNNDVLTSIRSVPSQPNLHLVVPKGQLEVHTANYRGSFSMVFSEALRSAGLGSDVLIAQFLKGGVAQGPENTINLCGQLEWLRPSFPYCLNKQYIDYHYESFEFEESKKAVEEVWEFCKQQLRKNSIHKMILDEIGLAIELGLIEEESLIAALEGRPDSIDVILTGPSIPSKVINMADQVTELRCCK